MYPSAALPPKIVRTMDQAPQTDDEIDRLARKRAGAKLGWYLHAAVYLAVNLLWFLSSDLAFGHKHWSPKPLLGWGFGLLLHWASVFLLGKGSGLRERMVQRERTRLLRERDGR